MRLIQINLFNYSINSLMELYQMSDFTTTGEMKMKTMINQYQVRLFHK